MKKIVELKDSVLTEQQHEFLLNNKLLDLFGVGSCTFNFINELFNIESANTPIDEPLFCCSLFEYISMLMYIFEPDMLIPTSNVSYNKDNIKKAYSECYLNSTLLDRQMSSSDNIVTGFKYSVNPLNQILTLYFTFDDLTIKVSRPHNVNGFILVKQVKYVITDFSDFMFKVIDIYSEFIGIMPQEELYIIKK
jgi:hypothetical protein